MRDVLRVDVKDGLGNGARNGAIGGLVMSLPVVITFASYCDGNCHGVGPFLVASTLTYVALGTGVGVAIDAMRSGRQSIYSASAPAAVAVAPMLSGKARGVRVTFSW
jgi:hypothetical protein